jgi:hypothetical protein
MQALKNLMAAVNLMQKAKDLLSTLQFTTIVLDPDNRMVRAGAGKHEGKWFIRIDVWYKGFRITKREKE